MLVVGGKSGRRCDHRVLLISLAGEVDIVACGTAAVCGLMADRVGTCMNAALRHGENG